MIRIRPAHPEDVKALQLLNSEVFRDNSKYDKDLDLGWSLSTEGEKYYSSVVSSDDSVCLVAEDDGKPVGYLSSGPKEEIGRMGRYFEIYDMGVMPEYRSHGIGKRLVEECFSRAKAKGFEKISVRVYSDNVKALEFYRRAGLKDLEIGLEKGL